MEVIMFLLIRPTAQHHSINVLINSLIIWSLQIIPFVFVKHHVLLQGKSEEQFHSAIRVRFSLMTWFFRYSKEQSTLVLPSESAIDFMSWKYNRTPTYVKNNFAKLNVYFEALNYETVEQKKAYEGKNVIFGYSHVGDIMMLVTYSWWQF